MINTSSFATRFARRFALRRNVAWSKRKEMEDALKSQAAQEQHESYELKFAGQDDANAYKRQMKEERRKSMEGRNVASSRAAQWAEEARQQKIADEHVSYELAWAGQDDAAAYKRQMKEEERQDYENRNREGFEQKNLREEQVRAKKAPRTTGNTTLVANTIRFASLARRSAWTSSTWTTRATSSSGPDRVTQTPTRGR